MANEAPCRIQIPARSDFPETATQRRKSQCQSQPQPQPQSHQQPGIKCVSQKVPQEEQILQPQTKDFIPKEVRFKYVIVLLTTYLGLGTLYFFIMNDQLAGKKTTEIVDAIYFCVVTMTTVGYGDLVPNGTMAKLLACIYVFMGMAICGLIITKAADYIVEQQEIHLVRALYVYEQVNSAEIEREAENNRVKYKFLVTGLLLCAHIIVGILFLWSVEEMALIDAFYCVCSTITTLGYGDVSFITCVGRIFAIFWIISSTATLAQFFLYLAELYTERRKKLLIDWVLSKKLTSTDLEEADLDNDHVVNTAEFVLYKLKEMGKICHEDIILLMDRFQTLDIDHSGTLTVADLMSP